MNKRPSFLTYAISRERLDAYAVKLAAYVGTVLMHVRETLSRMAVSGRVLHRALLTIRWGRY